MDRHPNQDKISALPTQPPLITSPIQRSRPGVLAQLGRALSYTSIGEQFVVAGKPSTYQLAAWDEARRKEPVIQNGISTIVRVVTKKIGQYLHEDPEIADFVNANLESGLIRWVQEMTHMVLWAGFGSSEVLWKYKIGPSNQIQIWVEDCVSYHPSQVFFVTNDNGRLTHGERISTAAYRSGVWVPIPTQSRKRPKGEVYGSMVRLPRSKCFYSRLGGESNQVYGQSILNPVLKYHLFKEAFRDMMTTALDRYGTPLFYIKVPNSLTQETTEDPSGEIRPLSIREQVISEVENLGSESVLVLTQTDKQNQPVEIGTITSSNNFADSFTQAIDLCDKNMMLGMNIPNLLVVDNTSALGSSGASERQLEVFDIYVSYIFDQVVGDFVDQVIRQLIHYNFDVRTRPLAAHPGRIEKRPLRVTDLNVMAGVIEKMTEMGFVNSANQKDFAWARDVLGMPARSWHEEDRPRGNRFTPPSAGMAPAGPASPPAASNDSTDSAANSTASTGARAASQTT
jgi:hypothetical protein